MRWAQARSSLRPRWPLVSCATRWRTLVTIRFASRTRCQWSTLIRAAGRAVSRADRNVAEGSIATTSIRSRQAGVRASSQPWMPVLLRPSTMPRTCPVSVLTNVLIHPQMPYPQGVDLGQLDHRGIDRVLHCPPRHPVAGRDFLHGAARVQHRIGQVFPQPGQAPRPGRELLGGLGERLPPASVLGAHHAGLPDHHLDHITAGRDATDPLLHPGMHPGRDHPAVRASLVPVDRLHHHTPATQRQVDRIDDVVSGQVEDNARSSTPRARRLVQGSSPSEVGCLTHPSARPRVALRYDTTTLNCEEPVILALRSAPGRSPSPSRPSVLKRCRRLQTVCGWRPSPSAILVVRNPCQLKEMIRALAIQSAGAWRLRARYRILCLSSGFRDARARTSFGTVSPSALGDSTTRLLIAPSRNGALEEV